MSVRELAREQKDLPLSLLDNPQVDLRDGRDEQKLDEIAADIARNGVLQPLIVVRTGERFEIVDGFTRAICAGRAGLVVVPCWIYADKTAALEGVKYSTAVFRLELTPAEEAAFFHTLFLGECEQDIDRVATRVGRSRSYVDSRLQLLLGDVAVLDAVRDGKVTLGVAALLNQITEDDWRRFYLGHAVQSGVTVSVMTGWLQQWKIDKAVRDGAPAPPAAMTTSSTAPSHDPFACHVCQKNDPRRIPQMVPIHGECLIAILEPMLAAYRGES
jgi:ParB/RepB/Spo0J family partition protein